MAGGLLVVVLIPVAAGVSAEAPADAPMALSQPFASMRAPIALPVIPRSSTFSEPGLIAIVGTALLGIAAVVRKAGS